MIHKYTARMASLASVLVLLSGISANVSAQQTYYYPGTSTPYQMPSQPYPMRSAPMPSYGYPYRAPYRAPYSSPYNAPNRMPYGGAPAPMNRPPVYRGPDVNFRR